MTQAEAIGNQTTTGDPPADEPLLDVRHLKMYFPIKSGVVVRRHVGDVKAVDDVSFTVKRGETLGLVGAISYYGSWFYWLRQDNRRTCSPSSL